MKRIVVGVEPTLEGRAAVAAALRHATRTGQPVTALRAWSDVLTGGFPAATGVDPVQAEQGARRLAEETVKEVVQQVAGGDGVALDVQVVHGGPGYALETASRDADLVVVGTRSAGFVSRALLGSVSEHVLRHARCPVMVVPAPQPSTSADPRVVVGVDHSPASLAALAWAAEEAARRQVVLVPVLVRDDEDGWQRDGTPDLRELEAAERQALVQAVPPGLAVHVEPELLLGHPGKQLVAATAPQDLLVVGTRGRSAAVSALLGSTSVHVAEHGHCPVVVLHA